ncbi:MAG: MBOAT family protein [Clostridiales bacterium]|nr:MBOAT family protein [Clostridiales bacterium]
MQFNSIHFLIFFPAVLLVYFVIPKKVRYIWLLAASYYFYMSWNAKYAILIAFSTVATYLCGIIIEQLSLKEDNLRYYLKRLTLALGIISNLLILFMFKYLDFTIDSINAVLGHFNISLIENNFDLLLPVGISFYTFQALGYIIDVYRKNVNAEYNILKYALFVSFFPQLVAGPIERSGKLMKQLNHADEIKLWNYERIVKGFMIMMWGYFMKVVISDRAATVVNELFTNYYAYDSVELIFGVTLFAVQIYCDFAGYSTIAVGAAKIMGFELMDNFDTPYFSTSIQEFWRRWHISLSSWFRDYLYIPLGGNRKGKIRKYINTMIVFLVSGLWHGADWTYVIWGGLHGFYQIVGDITKPVKEKCAGKLKIRTDATSYKLMKMAVTFGLTCFAWIFFAADNMTIAVEYIARIFTRLDPWALTDGTIYSLGLDRQQMNILIISIIVLLLVDLVKYKKGVRMENIADRQNSWVRPVIILSLVFAVIVFGAYGAEFDAQQFIYFQF